MSGNSFYNSFKQLADSTVKRYADSLSEWDSATPVAVLAEEEFISPVLPLNFEQLPRAVARCFEEKSRLPARQLYLIEKVYVTWKAAVIKNFRIFIPALAAPHWKNFHNDTYLLQQWLSEKVSADHPDQPVALVHDQWTRVNYYHWMVDALTRLLGLREQFPDAVLVLLEPVPAYVQHTVHLLGFEHFVTLKEKQVLSAQTLLVPEHVSPLGHHNPALLRQLRAEITHKLFAGNAAPAPTRRIYVSRSRQHLRRLANEPKVLEMLRRYGFDSVFFEDLSFAEQVALMRETAVFIGVHGANLTNILFLQSGSHVIELTSEEGFEETEGSNFEKLIYCRMSSSLELPYSVVLCQTAAGQQPSKDADLAVVLADLEQAVERALAEH